MDLDVYLFNIPSASYCKNDTEFACLPEFDFGGDRRIGQILDRFETGTPSTLKPQP